MSKGARMSLPVAGSSPAAMVRRIITRALVALATTSPAALHATCTPAPSNEAFSALPTRKALGRAWSFNGAKA